MFPPCPKEKIFIQAQTFDTSNNPSEACVNVYNIDRIAPNAPSDVIAKGDNGYIHLTWNVSDNDVKGFEIYRLQEGEYTKIASPSTKDYYDTNILSGKTYTYKMIATDTAGNKSDYSAETTANASPDTIKPIVYGFTMANNSVISPNTKIDVVMRDNNQLSQVIVAYKKNGDSQGGGNVQSSVESQSSENAAKDSANDIENETSDKVNTDNAKDNANLIEDSEDIQTDEDIIEDSANDVENGISDDFIIINTYPLDGTYASVKIDWDITELEEGDYTLKAIATDAAGNQSDAFTSTYTLDKTAPDAPTLTITPGNLSLTINWDGEKPTDFSHYRLYKRYLGQTFSAVGNSLESGYTDIAIDPAKTYFYQIETYDKAGNYSVSNAVTSQAQNIDDTPPLIKVPSEITVINGIELSLDASESTDNVRIESFTWDIGDGRTFNGARCGYIYDTPGRYEVTLTATDTSGNTATKAVTVEVMDKTLYGSAQIEVFDEKNNPIKSTHVYIYDSADNQDTIKTDSNGKALITAKPGEYKLAVYKDGYLPVKTDLQIKSIGDNGKTRITLKSGELVTGNLTTHRMSLEEMAEWGIDLSNPANYNTFSFTVQLTFAGMPIPTTIEYVSLGGGGGGYIGWGGGGNWNNSFSLGNGNTVQLAAVKREDEETEEPILAYITRPESVSFLKDMFVVDLGVINNADSNFTITDTQATLNLPKGLALISGDKTQTMGEIRGQESKSTSWAIRGDEKGEYNLDADFKGILMPFNVPVKANFKTDKPLVVSAGAGLHIEVMPETTGYAGEKYYIQYKLTNNSGHPYYNLTTSFGPYTVPGAKTVTKVTDLEGNVTAYEYENPTTVLTSINGSATIPLTYGDTKIIAFPAGATLYGTYETSFPGQSTMTDKNGNTVEIYYKLIESMITSISRNMDVTVSIKPVAGHITRNNIKMQLSIQGTWGDPVDTTTGAFTDAITAVSTNGAQPLNFDLAYNSLNAQNAGEAGYGWTHNYERRLEITDGGINLYSDSTNYTSFVNQDTLDGNLKGQLKGGEILITQDSAEDSIEYASISLGMKDYKIRRIGNTYILTNPDGSNQYFDQNGRLIKTIDAAGGQIIIDYAGDRTTITEPITGETLVINKNYTGQVTTVKDSYGKETTFTYQDNCLIAITNPDGDSITYTYDDQNRITAGKMSKDAAPFVRNTYDEANRVIEQYDISDSLTKFAYTENNDGTLTVNVTDRDNNHVQFTSNHLGHLTSFADQNGNETDYKYDNKGNLLKETNGEGATKDYDYDTKGNLLSITTAKITANSADNAESANNTLISTNDGNNQISNTTQISYDSRGNVSRVTDAAGNYTEYTYDANNRLSQSITPSGAVTNYTYNDHGQLIKEETLGLGATYHTYTNGRRTQTIDPMGNITKTTYDQYGNIQTSTDRDGTTTTYTYDQLNRLISVTDPAGTETYTYDQKGNKTSVTDKNNNTTYTYTNPANLTEKTRDASGSITQYQYNKEDRPIKIQKPDGTSLAYEYDKAGNVIKTTDENGEQTHFTYDGANRVTAKTQPNGETQTYEYNPDGSLKKLTLPDGGEIAYEYDNCGRQTKATDQLGNTTTTEYDYAGNIIATTDAEGNATTYTYDKYGRKLNQTDPNGNTTAYEYDANNRLIKTTNALGQETEFEYTGEGRTAKVINGENIVSYQYDSAGRVTKTTDAEGNTARVTYDANGNILNLIDAKGVIIQQNTYDQQNRLTKTTDAVGAEIQMQYDIVGNLKKRIEYLNIVAHPEDIVQTTTTYDYDNTGKLTKSTDAAGKHSQYTYDQVGNITTLKDPNGGVNTYKYDSVGNRIETINPIGAKNTYTYNAANLLTEEKNARGQKTAYTYYKNGWIKTLTDSLGTISYTYDNNGNVLTVNDNDGTITREYDALNRVTKYTDFRGNTVKYAYDQSGNLISLTYPGGKIVRYEYYKNGLLKTVKDFDNRATKYYYDPNGRLIKTTRANGTEETRKYDAVGHLTNITDKNGEEVINELKYAYDTAGNITEVSLTDGAVLTALSSATMEYDAANRLITYNGEEVKYDQDGNMTYGPLNGEMATFEYDCRNRLISVENTTYNYDAENNRIQKIENGVVTDYVVENSERLSRTLTETTAEVKTYYIYGTGLISQEKAGEKLYYHFNNLGSTIAISDINGEIVERFNYAPYGELQSENKTNITFLYNGECGVVTDNNGLYYMRARYYNPQIKRFINQDVLTGSINDSPTLNRYAYVQGNPISLTDPFGLSPDLNWAGAGHAALSVLGFIPVLGAFTDLANSIWYLFEGEIAKSLTSLVSALPGLGDLIGAGAKTVQLAKTAAAVKAMGLIGKSAVSGLSIGNTISTNIDRYLNGEKFTLGQVSIDITSIFLNAFAIKLSVNEAKKIEEMLGELIALNNAGGVGLSGAGSYWGNPNTLNKHFKDHGADFGAQDPQEYAGKANTFYKNRGNYQVKVDVNGVTRIYDPVTNSFGAYNADGTTRTFYKPTAGQAYFDRQPGVIK